MGKHRQWICNQALSFQPDQLGYASVPDRGGRASFQESGLLIFATKPLVKKFAEKDNMKTNVYSIVGKKAIVTEDIDLVSGNGQIKFDGQVWSAKSSEQINISKGTEVEIEKIEGVKAFVKPLNEHIIHN